MRDRFLLLLIFSTLFLKELWTLFPASEELKMFPYSDTLIKKQTYIWFLCYYAIQLIIVHIWYSKFPEYRIIFAVWFGFQVAEFVEFMLTYNESLLWFFVGPHKIDVNVINIKYLTIFFVTVKQFVWKAWT